MIYTLKNGCEMSIRDIREEDAAGMLEYLKRVGGESDFLTFGEEGVGFSLEEEKEFIRTKASSDDMLFVVAAVDSEIIAGLGIMAGRRERISHCGELGMSVRKDHWNQGVGGLLMDHGINWAREHKFKKINLSVREDNRRAISLYLKKGFQFEGRNRAAIHIGGEYYDVYLMGRML